MWNLRGVALLVGAVLGLSTTAAGATRTLQAQQVRTIVNEEGVGRVLVDFGALSEVSGQFITSAYLEFDLPSHRRQSDLNIQVLTLQRGWRDGATSWTQPWTRPGGDVDDTHSQWIELLAEDSASEVRINVTQAVRAIVEGEDASNGFLLTVRDGDRDGFTLSERSLFESISSGRLEIKTANPRAAGPLGAGSCGASETGSS